MSAAVRIEPVGLCGELIISSRVRGVIARRTASQSRSGSQQAQRHYDRAAALSSIAGT